ncbi:MAG: hypothetical protein U1A78_41645 [Polyangia bacterium]
MSGPVQQWIRRKYGAQAVALSARPANAATVTRDELTRLRAQTPSQIRAVAQKQIEAAWEALGTVSKVAWYSWADPVVRGANYVRWRPYVDALDEAGKALQLGDEEKSEAEKKTRYVSAYSQARATASTLAKDFQELGQTRLLLTIDLGGQAVAQTLSEAGSSIGAWFQDVGEQLRDSGSWFVKGLAVAGVGWLIARVLSK